MTKLSSILERGLELIKNPSSWTKGSFNQRSGNKYCYCMIGAIQAADRPWHKRHARLLENFADDVIADETQGQYTQAIGFNDSGDTTHSDVVKMFKVIIKKAKQFEKAGKPFDAYYANH